MAGAATLASPAGNAAEAPAARLIPFTRASSEHREPGLDSSVTAAQFGAGPTTLGPFDVPAFGYARGLYLLVEATAGAAGLNNAVSEADGPWSVIRSISVTDVNGAPLVGPFTGYDLMLVNKWGGYSFDGDPTRGPGFSDVAVTGNFTILLYVPFEIIARDAYGALANMNAASTYKVHITCADDADVYSTAPDTLPGVRFRSWLDAWAQPTDADPDGNPQATRPPFLGTTQFWSKASLTVANGANTLRLPRVGNFIRTLLFVFRDSTAAREGATWPDPLQIHMDGRIIFNDNPVVYRGITAEKYGYNLTAVATANDDEGVAAFSFSHDFDGKPGAELKDLYLPTVQSTRLEFVGSIAEVGSLDILTNDISPVGHLL